MKRYRRGFSFDLFIADNESLFKIKLRAVLIFPFVFKTGMGIPKVGVSFYWVFFCLYFFFVTYVYVMLS